MLSPSFLSRGLGSWNSRHLVAALEIGVIIILFSWLVSIPTRSQSFDYSVVNFLSSFPLTNIADKLKQLQLIYTQNNVAFVVHLTVKWQERQL